ncbi:MAG TPA: shikimate dehydrogenase [Geothermobacteraceae bacterium]|nr:shikimate dehydrogenase [Geothermobacteraceae bacterium]
MKDSRSLNFNTRLCAVIGNPVSHSLSPAIHNAGFDALGLDFIYLPCQVEDVAGVLAGMRAMHNFRGMSVTIPHKIEAMKHVDEINAADRTIGSINTIINDNGKLIGLGTDGPGAMKALIDADVVLAGKQVLMIGAGGAARAISFTLALKAGLAGMELLDIDEAVVTGLAADLNRHTQTRVTAQVMSETNLTDAMSRADIIIHSTPIGMQPKVDASLVPVDLFRSGQVVFDVVYTPLETKLLREAKVAGLQTISGVEMFINQAVLQFEQFTGQQAPIEVMRKVVMEHLTS